MIEAPICVLTVDKIWGTLWIHPSCFQPDLLHPFFLSPTALFLPSFYTVWGKRGERALPHSYWSADFLQKRVVLPAPFLFSFPISSLLPPPPLVGFH